MKRKVYICAPIDESPNKNLNNAKEYANFVLKDGAIPIVPQFYAFCLNENEKNKTDLIKSICAGLLLFSDEMWIFGDSITDKMKADILFCKNLNIKMRRIKSHNIIQSLEKNK